MYVCTSVALLAIAEESLLLNSDPSLPHGPINPEIANLQVAIRRPECEVTVGIRAFVHEVENQLAVAPELNTAAQCD